MHPVESTIYYTATFIPVLLGAHPLIFLFCKMDLNVAALIGHSGFEFPGSGSQPHWLHHAMVNCNCRGHVLAAFGAVPSAVPHKPTPHPPCSIVILSPIDGENSFPLDYWMGTYAADEADFAKNIAPRFQAAAQKKKAS